MQVAAPLAASAHAAINSGRAARRWIGRTPGMGGGYEAELDDLEEDADDEDGAEYESDDESELEW